MKINLQCIIIVSLRSCVSLKIAPKWFHESFRPISYKIAVIQNSLPLSPKKSSALLMVLIHRHRHFSDQWVLLLIIFEFIVVNIILLFFIHYYCAVPQRTWPCFDLVNKYVKFQKMLKYNQSFVNKTNKILIGNFINSLNVYSDS